MVTLQAIFNHLAIPSNAYMLQSAVYCSQLNVWRHCRGVAYAGFIHSKPFLMIPMVSHLPLLLIGNQTRLQGKKGRGNILQTAQESWILCASQPAAEMIMNVVSPFSFSYNFDVVQFVWFKFISFKMGVRDRESHDIWCPWWDVACADWLLN